MNENILKSISKLELVIFDLDGTLIDSNGMHNILDIELVRWLGEEKNEEEILKDRDEFFKENKSGDIYLNYCDFLKNKYHVDLSKENILQYRRDLSKDLSKSINFKPQADEMIKYLKSKKINIALGTVSRKSTLDIYCNENKYMKEKCNLYEYFDYILTKDDVKKKKPDPEVYIKILQKFGITDNSKSLVIEDSLTGVKAAKNANLRTIVMYDKYSDKDRDEINKLADYSVNDYSELIDIFKNVYKGGNI